MLMKHPRDLQSGKWQRRGATNSRCAFFAHGANLRQVDRYAVQRQLCFSHPIQGNKRSVNTKLDIS